MPDRVVRAKILTSDSVCSLSWAAEVFYRRLFSIADDYGLHDARVSILRAGLYPLQLEKVSVTDVAAWLHEAEQIGLVKFYEDDGKSYLQIQKFDQRTQGHPKCPVPPWGLPEQRPKGKPPQPAIPREAPGVPATEPAPAEAEGIVMPKGMQAERAQALMKRIGSWWGRADSTRWTSTEFDMLRDHEKTGLWTEDVLGAVEAYIPTCEPKYRGSISTFLQNPHKFIDRATSAKKPHANTRTNHSSARSANANVASQY
jgi:hypothetical protein